MGTERIVSRYKVWCGTQKVGDYSTLRQARKRVMELLEAELIMNNSTMKNYGIEEYATTERIGW